MSPPRKVNKIRNAERHKQHVVPNTMNIEEACSYKRDITKTPSVKYIDRGCWHGIKTAIQTHIA